MTETAKGPDQVSRLVFTNRFNLFSVRFTGEAGVFFVKYFQPKLQHIVQY
jgi:hypothetical protein